MSKSPRLEEPFRLVLCAETAADLMTRNPVSLNAAATVKEAAAFLADRGVSAAPVIDEAGRPVGVLSRSDIVMHERANVRPAAASPDDDATADLSPCPVRITWTDLDVLDGENTPVSDVMTPAVFSVAPETPAHRVIEEMLARKVHRLFVVGVDGVLTGVISALDVLRHLRREEPVPGEPTACARPLGEELS